MAKININFNNTEYSIDESALSAATANLQSHLSTSMNGSGAVINLGGISYNIDSTKLSDATNNFVSHLRTIAGSGSKVVVGGVEYSIDSTKMANVVSDLETVFGNLQTGIRLEAGLYDANDNLLASWDTLVNTYGWDCEKSYDHHAPWAEQNHLSCILSGNGWSDTGKKMVIGNVTRIGSCAFYALDFTCITIPACVTSIGQSAFSYCEKLKNVYIDDIGAWCNISFVDSSSNPLSEGATLYLNNEPVTTVEIPNTVNKLRSTFAGYTSLTSVTIPDSVTSIDASTFLGCTGLTSITIPDSVTSIGKYAFNGCTGLAEITFNGTIEQWNVITKGSDWNKNVPATYVQCSDGAICFSHTGGTATCQQKAICSVCGNEYGELAACTPENGVCTVCGREGDVWIKPESIYGYTADDFSIRHKETGVLYEQFPAEGIYVPAGTYIVEYRDDYQGISLVSDDIYISLTVGLEFELSAAYEYTIRTDWVDGGDFS